MMRHMIATCIAFLAPLFVSPLYAEWDPKKLQEWEKETINDIFLTMAEKSVPSLLFEGFRLTRLGDKIQHVPPLQFLGYIMSTPRLKNCIRSISHSYFKWPFFLEGVQDTMEKEYYNGSLFSDLPDFAKLVGGDYEQLRRLCECQKWEEFVKALL